MRELSVKKILFIIILVGILGMSLQFGLRVQRTACDGAYILSFKQDDQSFSDLDLLNIEEQGVEITYVQRIYQDVTNGFRSEEISVFATNENYAYFTDAYLVKGSFFNEMQVNRKLPLAVINEAAAYQLFGNQECVGNTVYLNGIIYEVYGVMAESEENGASIYIPYSTMVFLGISKLETDQIWCRFSNLAEAALVLGKAGYSLEMFKILQMDLVKSVFWQRFFCPLILTGIYIMFCIWKSVSKKAKRIKRDEKIDKKRLKEGVLQILGACAGIYLLCKMVDISWCAPPAYELLGMKWKEVIYSILNFYLLADMDIRNMPFLAHWNLVSATSMIVYLYFFSLFAFCHKTAIK